MLAGRVAELLRAPRLEPRLTRSRRSMLRAWMPKLAAPLLDEGTDAEIEAMFGHLPGKEIVAGLQPRSLDEPVRHAAPDRGTDAAGRDDDPARPGNGLARRAEDSEGPRDLAHRRAVIASLEQPDAGDEQPDAFETMPMMEALAASAPARPRRRRRR
ncbi:MAG: hypothetical protein JNL87_06320 [Burkholderiaceae bacterium]|nr:hypothetical protein [Burkholderiaceae bacterium]